MHAFYLLVISYYTVELTAYFFTSFFFLISNSVIYSCTPSWEKVCRNNEHPHLWFGNDVKCLFIFNKIQLLIQYIQHFTTKTFFRIFILVYAHITLQNSRNSAKIYAFCIKPTYAIRGLACADLQSNSIGIPKYGILALCMHPVCFFYFSIRRLSNCDWCVFNVCVCHAAPSADPHCHA